MIHPRPSSLMHRVIYYNRKGEECFRKHSHIPRHHKLPRIFHCSWLRIQAFYSHREHTLNETSQPFFNSKANITATEVLFFLPVMASLPDGLSVNEHAMEIFLCVKDTVKDIFLKAKV